jgi:hypothetical protein
MHYGNVAAVLLDVHEYTKLIAKRSQESAKLDEIGDGEE